MTWPAVVLWVAIAAAAARRDSALLYLFMIAAPFGALQMLPGQAIGGINILPQAAVAAVLVAVVMLQPGNMARALASALDPRRMGLLVAFAVYGVLTALILPRVFADQVDVIAMNPVDPAAVLLTPTSANINQSAYMLLSTATALALSLVSSRADFRTHYPRAVLAGGAVMIATGVLDFVTSSVGLDSLLDPFRTASYALLTDAEVLGARRIVGLMPEASVFGGTCVGMAANLIFLSPCFAPRMRRMVVPCVVAGLVAMAVLSTSSTAFGGLAVLGGTYALSWLVRLRSSRDPGHRRLLREMAMALGAVFVLIALSLLAPSLLDPVWTLLDSVLFQKAGSSSYIERSMWNRVGLDAFFATGGMGVGLGSVRTSNWLIATLGSTGVIGAALLSAFVLRFFFARSPGDRSVTGDLRRALRFSLVPNIAMAALSATTPDIGLANATLFGVLTGLLQGPTASKPAAPRDRRAPALVRP